MYITNGYIITWISIVDKYDLGGHEFLSVGKKETWIQVPKDTRFVNSGVDINGEIGFFRFILIDNLGMLGFVVVDPDGNQISEIMVENEEIVISNFYFENRKYALQLLATPYSYELIFSES